MMAAGALLVRPVAVRPPPPGDGREVVAVNQAGAEGAELLDRVRAGMGAATAAVEQFWGTDWSREVVVVATGTPAQFAAESHLDPRGEWADIAAVSVADEVDLSRRRATGQRIVLAPGASRMSAAALHVVLTHELFHLAARADTALDAPRWLTEGVADFVARPPAALPADAGADTGLPSDTALDNAGPQRASGYDRAWWFARFVADTYGVAALRDLYAAACGPGHGNFAAAVGQALGTDLANLHLRWGQWLNR